MLIIAVCIGSSCHLKGSYEIVEAFKRAIEENKLEDEVTLTGSFCIGKCNREGVTVQINDEVFTGVTIEKFDEFFSENVMERINRGE